MSELRKCLENVDAGLAEQLGQVWKKAEAGIHEAIHTKEGHIGGKVHSDAVEHNVWRLIPKEWRNTDQFRPIDLFLLSAAAALHDAGRVPFGGDFDPDLDHGRLSEKRIRANPGNFELSQHEADVVGMIVRPHNDGDLSTLDPDGWALSPYGLIDVRKLAALLRLGDILHIAGRVSPQVIDSSELTGKARAKTLFRELVADWDLVEDRQAIRLFASTATTEEHDVVFGGVEVTARDLEPIAAALQSCGLPHRFATPKVNTDKIKWAEEERTKEARALIGLDYFHENDAEAFKGRDSEIAELQQRVIGNQVSLLVGASGAGKTSIILAGLFPKMKRAGWKCVHTRPWLTASTAVRREDFKGLLGYVPAAEVSLATVVDKASSVGDSRDVLICIDQFEDAADLLSLDAGKDLQHLLSLVQSGRFPNIHILIAYRVEGESSLGRLWQDIAGSAAGLPKVYLDPLSRRGAQQALGDALTRAQVGLQPRDVLMKQVLDDLESETRRLGHSAGIYPPYIRMVAETIISQAASTERIFSQESYSSTGTSRQIIGDYLFRILESLHSDRSEAERVLKALTSSGGAKLAGSIQQIASEAQISAVRLASLLNDLVGQRLVRQVGAEWEIAHDYLAQLVWHRLVESNADDVQFKALADVLAAKTRSYSVTRELLANSEMRALYRHRQRLTPLPADESIIFRSLLLEDSVIDPPVPGWYWIRHWKRDRICDELIEMLLTPTTRSRIRIRTLANIPASTAIPRLCLLLTSDHSAVLPMALEAVARIGTSKHLGYIKPLLSNRDEGVREVAARTYGNLGEYESIHEIKQLLSSPNLNDHQSGAIAFCTITAKLDVQSDFPLVRELLNDDDWKIRQAAMEATSCLLSEDLSQVGHLLDESAWHVRWIALETLRRHGSHTEIKTILPVMEDRDPDVRVAAVAAFAALADKDDLPTLMQLMQSKEWQVRKAATEAFVRLRAAMDPSELVRLIDDDNECVAQSAVRLLAVRADTGDYQIIKSIIGREHRRTDDELIKAYARLAPAEDIARTVPILFPWVYTRVWSMVGAAIAAFRPVPELERFVCFDDLPDDIRAVMDTIAYMPACLRPALTGCPGSKIAAVARERWEPMDI